jgi:hypothetical protein
MAKIGEVRKVYPPEGMTHINAQGNVIMAEGTPLTITKQLLALAKARLIRIDDSTSDQPPAPPPTPPVPPQPPQTDPDNTLDINTPTQEPEPVAASELVQPQGSNLDQLRAAKLEQIRNMNSDQLREFVKSIGQDPEGKRRGSLLSLARAHVESLPEDQLV